MAFNQSYLRLTAVLAMILSALFFAVAVAYAFISNLSFVWIIFLIIIALVEIIVFTFSVLFFLDPKRRIFFIGLLTLFAGLIPGVMLLSFYFKSKMMIVKNFEANPSD